MAANAGSSLLVIASGMKGSAVLIIIAVIALVSKTNAGPSMEDIKAAWSRYGKVSDGDARYYGEYPVGTGACELDPMSPVNSAPGWIKVAASKDDVLKSVGCGMCIEIQGDGTPKDSSTVGTPVKGTLKATIVDICGGCKQAGFDLYIPGNGVYKTTFKAIECAPISGQNGNIHFRFDGSNAWYLKLQVRNTKIVTAGLEILLQDKWICMKRTDNNHFTISNVGKMEFPIKVRVTSIANEQLESAIEKLVNDVDIPSKIQYSGFIADSKPEDIKCYGQGGVTQEPKQPGSGGNSKTKPSEGEGQQPGEGQPSTTKKPTEGAGQQPGEGLPSSNTKPTKGASEQPGEGQPSSNAKPTEGAGQQPGEGQPSSNTKPAEGAGQQPGEGQTSPGGSRPKGGQNQGEFCGNRKDGLYPDNSDSAGFIVCSHHTAIKKDCPKGLLFNKEIKVCDWPRNVSV